jgi:hypothetical protein
MLEWINITNLSRVLFFSFFATQLLIVGPHLSLTINSLDSHMFIQGTPHHHLTRRYHCDHGKQVPVQFSLWGSSPSAISPTLYFIWDCLQARMSHPWPPSLVWPLILSPRTYSESALPKDSGFIQGSPSSSHEDQDWFSKRWSRLPLRLRVLLVLLVVLYVQASFMCHLKYTNYY